MRMRSGSVVALIMGLVCGLVGFGIGAAAVMPSAAKVDCVSAFRGPEGRAEGYMVLSALARSGADHELVEVAIRGAPVDFEPVDWRHMVGAEYLAELTDSPLCVASGNGHIRTVLVLIWLGADVDNRCHAMKTALIIARAGGHVDVADALLNRGASPSVNWVGDSLQ